MTSGESSSTLPQLNPEQARHAAAVAAAVRAAIEAQGGWLAFDDYLRLVLYAPALGYYSAGSVKFGAGGDFVTASELSPLYAHCMAVQCAALLQTVGGDVLELGAGTGRFATGVLERLAELERLPDHYYILEVSADLRARQAEAVQLLPEALRRRVAWLEALPAVPMKGVVLANEVADALPFQRFLIDSDAVYERGVGIGTDGALIDVDRPASAALRAELDRIAPDGWPVRYQSELCPMLGPWIAAIAAALACGAVFLIDYGLPRHEYYHWQRDHGTLRCHYRHRAHDDPLLYPGLQDITAWVDFTRVAEAADDAQLTLAGYCTQAAFLLSNGIEAELAAAADGVQRARLASQARMLLLPAEMGERFKVMALTRGFDEPMRGFALQDLRGSL
ncbi:MAG TPA: SAM-dependent methyltransferase [Steroidobacteraceae bacterium]|nr:SAM-dependent methyltransferase [Steroidobacteraceae bacterium]